MATLEVPPRNPDVPDPVPPDMPPNLDPSDPGDTPEIPEVPQRDDDLTGGSDEPQSPIKPTQI